MKNYYIFAIGGTGSRCLESYIYLCALGLGPERVVPIIIDPHEECGNLVRTKELLDLYNSIRNRINYLPPGSLFYTKLENFKYWNPRTSNLANNEVKNNLRDFINYTHLPESEKLLSQLLFKNDHLDTDLQEGFVGVPSIGSFPLHTIVEQQFFKDLVSSYGQDKENRAFIFASIFGGTGASGYPVIAKLLKNRFPSNKVGGSIIFPYFSLKQPTQEYKNIKKVYPDSSKFIPNAIAAIPFYKNEVKKYCDLSYILGDHQKETKEFDEKKQKNNSHFIELYAAMAAVDFYSKNTQENERFCTIRVENPKGVDQNELSDYTNDRLDYTIRLNDFPKIPSDIGKSFIEFGLFINSFISLFNDKTLNANLEILLIYWLKKNIGLDSTLLNNNKNEIRNISKFLESFKIWISQMKTNQASLQIFNDDFILSNLLIDDSKKFFNCIPDDLDEYFMATNIDIDSEGTSSNSPVEKILRILNKGIVEFNEERSKKNV